MPNNNKKKYLRRVMRDYGHDVTTTFLQNLAAKKPHVQIRRPDHHVKTIMKDVLAHIDPDDIRANNWPPHRIYHIIGSATNDYIDKNFP